MVIFLYTNDKCEYQAKYCIQSFQHKLKENDKIIYFTIDFDSSISYKNLQKIRIPYKDYPTFHYYKAELSLLVMELFPDEEHFCFTDTDILFSKRINFDALKHDLKYPLASFGPHEYPFTYEILKSNMKYEFLEKENSLIKLENDIIGTLVEDRVLHNEIPSMRYFNVPNRTMRYVWSCFYSFNKKCKDFFQEYTSMCQNKYLISNRYSYYPFHDETPFNLCLWKRGATQNLGFAFVNTHSLNVVSYVETTSIKDRHIGQNIDSLGADWEYIENSENIILYHGFKDETISNQTLQWLINNSYKNE
jgi:hypothetical protein